ncbi:hypothetical protein PWT90_00987 [Aphanocladium album]|nr:hypothetical protein PWT90_00987 [Aphanocladium album]
MATFTPASSTTAGTTPNGTLTPSTDAAAVHTWLRVAGSLDSTDTHDPIPGDTVVIVDKTYSRVLACHPGGHLLLDDVAEYDMHEAIPDRWKWLCTERDNFLGFCSVAEETFLGHNFWWNFVAQARVQKGWEHFLLVRQHDGYRVQCPRWGGFEPLAARADGSGIEIGRPECTVWGFVRV